MANAKLIQALVQKLMKAKSDNQRMPHTDMLPDDGTGGIMETTDDALRAARQNLQAAQPSDPLATTSAQQHEGIVPGVSGQDALRTELGLRAGNRSMFEGGPEGGSITDGIRRTKPQDPSRLPDSTSGRASDFD